MADAFRELSVSRVPGPELDPKRDGDSALTSHPFEALNIRQLSVWACGRPVSRSRPGLFRAAPVTAAPVALEPAMSPSLELGVPAPRARRAYWIACALVVLATGLLVTLLTSATGA